MTDYPKLLVDAPAYEDAFTGGAHSRVAESLVRLCTQSSGGYAIGIEGTWGSGKSTVIEIARQQLESPAPGRRHSLFVFDAWAHHGDPTRRVILETLITEARSKGLLTDSDLTSEIDELRGRIKRTITKSHPVLTGPGIAGVIWLLLLPILFAWMGPGSFTKSSIVFNIAAWRISLSIALGMIVYFLAVVLWATIRARKAHNPLKPTGVFAEFLRGVDHSEVHQTIREEEPTTIEFNAIFDRLISKIQTHANCAVVIVLDNLDRLPAELLRSTWSTMRNFFAAGPNANRNELLKNVWLVVPFDRDHITTVFSNDYPGRTHIPEGKSGDSDPASSSQRATHGFIEKTFRVILRVPPPLLTDWNSFLHLQIEEAFGSLLSANNQDQISQHLRIYFQERHLSITPRLIKQIINDIVVLYSQWNSDIHPLHQLLYALYREDIARDVSRLQRDEIPPKRSQQLVLDSDWKQSLAALHYNVAPSSALQVLMRADIEKAIESLEQDELLSYATTTGFELVLLDIVEDRATEWAMAAADKFGQICALIAKSESKAGRKVLALWDVLAQAGTQLSPSWEQTDGEVSAGLEAVLMGCSEVRVFALAARIAKSFARSEGNTEWGAGGEQWVNLIDNCASRVKERLGPEDSRRAFTGIVSPGTFEFQYQVAAGIRKASTFSASDVRFADIQGLASWLTERVTTDSLSLSSAELWLAFSVLATRFKEAQWTPIVNGVKTRLSSEQPEVSDDLRVLLLELLLAVRQQNQAVLVDTAIRELYGDGTLFVSFDIGHKSGNVSMMGVTTCMIITAKGSLRGNEPQAHAKRGALQSAIKAFQALEDADELDVGVVNAVANYFGMSDGFAPLFTALIEGGPGLRFCAAVMGIVVLEQRYTRLSARQVITEYDALYDNVEPDIREAFLRKFDRWASVLKDSKRIDDDGILQTSSKFLRDASEDRGEAWEVVRGRISELLSNLSKEQWTEAFQSESDEVRLAITMAELGYPFEFTGAFEEALRKHADAVLEGQIEPVEAFGTGWHMLPMNMSDATRNIFYRDLVDAIGQTAPEEDRIIVLFDAYDPEFSREGSFEGVANVILRAAARMVLGRKPKYMQWLQNHGAMISDSRQIGGRDDSQHLRQEFVKAISVEDDKTEQLWNIAKDVGFKIRGDEPGGNGEGDAEEGGGVPANGKEA